MNMIAKFQIQKVTKHNNSFEELEMMAVTEKPFDTEGNSDDNSFARWTPSGSIKMGVQNPSLIGKFSEGEKYYVRFEKAAALILMLIALCFGAQAQTSTEQPHQTFFNSVTSYFAAFNTNYDSVFATHKGTIWAGQDWQGGAHASSSLGLEYIVYKQFSFDSETRFADLTGNVKSQQIGVGYNVDVHDVRLTGFAAGGYDFETDKAYPVIGLRAKKLLTDHTFSFVEFVVPIEKQARPRLGFGLGFVF